MRPCTGTWPRYEPVLVASAGELGTVVGHLLSEVGEQQPPKGAGSHSDQGGTADTQRLGSVSGLGLTDASGPLREESPAIPFVGHDGVGRPDAGSAEGWLTYVCGHCTAGVGCRRRYQVRV